MSISQHKSEAGKARIVSPKRSGRREAVRYPFVAPAEVTEVTHVTSGTRVRGRTTDISFTGCYVETLTPMGLGIRVHLRIQKDEEVFETFGTVRFTQTGMGMGIGFTETRPDQMRVLRAWLVRLQK